MMRALHIFSLCMLLSACGLLTGTSEQQGIPAPQNQPGALVEPATPTPVMPPELKGDLEIQQLMLTSHTRWHTLHVIYTLNQYPPPGASMESEQQNVQAWIEQPAKFKVVISTPKGGPQSSVICDGKTIVDNAGQQQSLPPSVLEPFNPPNSPSDTVYTHPLAGFLGTPVSDLIFPAGLAQRGGQYKQTGQELVADRQAYVVEWSREPGKLIDRLWVDAQTGIILRQQNYGKENATSPLSDYQATYVEINSGLEADIFNLAGLPTQAPSPQPPAPGTAWVTVKAEVDILNVRSQPDTSYKVITTMKAGQQAGVLGKNAAGDWWQVKVDGTLGWVFGAMVDFSGDPAAVPVVPQ
jgi:outer membrane lipoprotein-sorting protein